MLVRVLYFAGARDLSSASDERVEVRDGADLGELTRKVLMAHPRLKSMGRSVRFSVNLEVAEEGVRLKEGDVVGVLPPVAGG